MIHVSTPLKDFARAAKISLKSDNREEDGESSERLVEMHNLNTKAEELERHHQEQLDMIEAAGLEMSHFLQREGLSHTVGKLREFGIDSLTDLDDAQILSDQILKSEVS
jgi:hypothetical protein